jgi:hypothetical protein
MSVPRKFMGVHYEQLQGLRRTLPVRTPGGELDYAPDHRLEQSTFITSSCTKTQRHAE